MTKNKLALLAVFCIIAAISAALLYSRNLRKHIDETNARIAAESAANQTPAAGQAPAVAFDGIGGMSISGMEIVQGEKGREIWRLRAESALMSGQNGEIVAQRPHLTYYLDAGNPLPGGERGFITVESDTGDVDQQNNIMRFVGNVVAIHESDVLTTSLIIYEGATERLNCPEESFIRSEGMSGRANEMSWHLDDNILHARGGVNVNFDTARRTLPALGGANR